MFSSRTFRCIRKIEVIPLYTVDLKDQMRVPKGKICVSKITTSFCYLWSETLSAKGKPVIVLLFNAGPLDIIWAKMNSGVHVIMECFLPAQSTGFALARTFMNQGEAAVPAGRLPATWPTNLQQVLPIISRKSEIN